jgi:hypothetical protein
MNPEPPLASDAPASGGSSVGGAQPASDPEPAPEGLAASAQAAWRDLRLALHERARLLTLELRLAGLTFVQLVLYAVMVAVLVISAWIGLIGAMVVALISYGVHWGVGLAVAIVLNLAFAAWLVRSMLGLIDRLDLHSSLQRLQGGLRTPE